MRFASVAEVKRHLSDPRTGKAESIVITHHGKPYALIRPLTKQGVEPLEWKGLTRTRLESAWGGEDDARYDYL